MSSSTTSPPPIHAGQRHHGRLRVVLVLFVSAIKCAVLKPGAYRPARLRAIIESVVAQIFNLPYRGFAIRCTPKLPHY
jgi:hypothetical protein